MTTNIAKIRAPFEVGYYKLDAQNIDKLVEFHQESEPPYQMMELGKKFEDLGSFWYQELYAESNISGYIKKEGDKYNIYINKSEPLPRRRFTAAHELAHLLLHKDKIGNDIYDDVLYRSKLSTIEEVEANKLAADILMPMWKIKEIVDAGERIRDLPQIFHVSRTAMCIRLDINEIVLSNS